MRVLILTIFFLFSSLFSLAQNLSDSLTSFYQNIELLELSKKDSSLFESKKHLFTEIKEDSSFLSEVLQLSVKFDNRPGRRLNEIIMHYLEAKKKSDLSKKDLNKILYFLAKTYNNESYYQNRLGNKDKSITLLYQSLEIRKQLKDTLNIAKSLTELGTTHFNLLDYDEAENRIEEALSLQIEIGDSAHMGHSYMLLGAFATRMKKIEEAKQYYQQALIIDSLNKNLLNLSETFYFLGNLYYDSQNDIQAIEYYEKSLHLTDSLQETQLLTSLLYSLVQANQKLNRWAEAKPYALRAMDQAMVSNYPTDIHNSSMALYKVYLHEKNYQKSLEMFQQAIRISDSLNSQKYQRSLHEQEFQAKFKQDSLKNAIQMEGQIARRKSTINFLWIGLGLALIFGLILWNRFAITRKQKLIIEKDKIELDLANQKLKSLDELKARFFTNISHEIRTPLTVIKGMAEQIKNDSEKWAKRGVYLIEKNTNQLLNLTNQILELRKLESGSLKLHLIHEDIIPFLRYIVDSFHFLAETKDIRLHFLTETPQQFMDYDPEKITRIISNLLSNAIKFSNEGGDIYLQIDSISKGSESILQIKVKDQGKGIPNEELAHVFDRFYQVNKASKEISNEGSGIGLALVKELVKLMQGEIEAKSTMNQGSTFSVLFPIKSNITPEERIDPINQDLLWKSTTNEMDVQAVWASSEYDPEKDRETILIVEDNADVREFLAGCLEDFYQIKIAKNGQEGIDIALEVIPDIIISDVMMPIKDGFEVCSHLKQETSTSHIPIILLTARADVESKLSGLTRGADVYLTKPFNKQELLIRIDNLLKTRLRLQERYRTLKPQLEAQDGNILVEDEFIKKVRISIENNIDNDDFKITELCRQIGLSRSQLHRKIKALTGYSTSYFIHRIRLTKALELLKTSKLNISEIAYLVGYKDIAYFARNFKNQFGQSPKNYREQ